jgi:hypothetical protein
VAFCLNRAARLAGTFLPKPKKALNMAGLQKRGATKTTVTKRKR